ncbi:hypothetical protein U6B65_05680 [Oscillospiraceae bacterium MB08-C2-2]|nr:hypothetical protein U6B65_05680 [Oscillospiraceae bacterium MB08-C2-2]
MKFEDLRNVVEDTIEAYQRDPEIIPELIWYQANFNRYTFKNTMSIHVQNRYATHVASQQEWRKQGYSVKRSEKGLYIWAPVISKSFVRPDGDRVGISNATDQEKRDIAIGNILTKDTITYRLGRVFDISQTTCPPDDYPRFYSRGYQNFDHRQLFDSLRIFAEKSQFRVGFADAHSVGLGGYYNPGTNEITLSNQLKDIRKLSALCHELSLGLMNKTSTQPTTVKEFEAEGLSVMLLHQLGLPAGEEHQQTITQCYQRIDQTNYSLEGSFNRIQKAFHFTVRGLQTEIARIPTEETVPFRQQQEAQRNINANFMLDMD